MRSKPDTWGLSMQALKYAMSRAIAGAAISLGACSVTPVAERPAEQAVSQQAAMSSNQQRAKVHTELGSLYLQKGNLAVALDEGRVALAADPNYAPAHSLMGLAYMQLRENAAAESSFEQALRIAPGDPEFNNNFGWFLCQTGREQRSLAYFNVAIKSPLYSTPAMPNTNAGMCLLRIKDDKGAEDYFMRALRLESGNVRAIFFLADISYRQGRLGAARQHLTELHRIAEPSAESLWLALRVERKFGDHEAELQLGAQLRRKFPASPELQNLVQGQFE